ncbi:fused MFS/spermidine synthase [bacterium]|nr:fused MFS/spermidine synthase [bacterium]
MLFSRAPLFLVFLLSGFSGLVFEVLWVRLASLGLGITVYAVSLVVASFMGGLAFGGWLASRFADRRQLGVRAYAFMELGIALSGPAASWLLKNLPSWVTYPPLMMVLAALAMLVPCTLMGATIPVLSRAVLDPRVPGRSVGWLYGINTLGAMLGSLATDVLLVPHLGIWSSALVAASLNLTAGLVSLSLGELGQPAPRPQTPEATRTSSIYKVYGLSGATALALQGVWVRLLGVAIDARIWVFSLILTTFLACLAAGSWLGSWVLPRLAKKARLVLVILFCVLVLSTLLGTLTLTWLEPRLTKPFFSQWLIYLVQPFGQELGWGLVYCLVRSICLFALPTLCMGLAFPYVCAVAIEESGGIGEPIGRLYTMNTMGAILGSLCSGFLLIPYLGVQHSILLLSFCNLACAALVAVPAASRLSKRLALTAAGLACLIYAALPGNWLFARYHQPVYQRRYDIKPSEIVEFTEDLYGTVAVATGTTRGSVLLVNGTMMMGSTLPARRYARLMAHLPLTLHPAPKKMLVICFGLGMTFGAASLHDELENLQCAELSPTVLRMAPHFREFNENVAQRLGGRIQVHLADGRNFQLRSKELYDVITFEPPPPLQPGVVNLYSKDYYALCKQHLTPNGLVCQWLPVTQFSDSTARMMVRSFLEVFPDSAVWQGSIDDYFIIGGNQPISVERARLQQFARQFQEPLRQIGIADFYDLIASLRQGPAALARYSASAPAITDNHPYLEYAQSTLPPVQQLRETDFSELGRMVKGLSPQDLAQVERRAQAQQALLEFAKLTSPLNDGVSKYLLWFDRARSCQSVYSDNLYVADVLNTSDEKLSARRASAGTSAEASEDYAFRLLLARDASAQERLESLLREHPERPLAYILSGLLQREAGREGQARARFEEGLKRIPDPNARQILTQALLSAP